MGDIQISPSAVGAITSLLGVLGGVVAVLYRAMVNQYETRLREHKETIQQKDAQILAQTTALNRLAEVVESWTPERQSRRGR